MLTELNCSQNVRFSTAAVRRRKERRKKYTQRDYGVSRGNSVYMRNPRAGDCTSVVNWMPRLWVQCPGLEKEFQKPSSHLSSNWTSSV